MKYDFPNGGTHKTDSIAVFEKEIALPGKASIVFLRKGSKEESSEGKENET